MSGRTVLLALVAVALAAALVWTRYFQPAGGPLGPTSTATTLRPIDPPLATRLARLDARLRLAPDRRAIAAIAEVRRLVRQVLETSRPAICRLPPTPRGPWHAGPASATERSHFILLTQVH